MTMHRVITCDVTCDQSHESRPSVITCDLTCDRTCDQPRVTVCAPPRRGSTPTDGHTQRHESRRVTGHTGEATNARGGDHTTLREWPALPPDIHEAVVQALAEALVLDYRRHMVGSPAGIDHAPVNDGWAA